jgi:zinc protease
MNAVLTRVLAVLVPIILATPAPAQVFNPETFHLANGMQVVVVPNHRVPIVSHMVWYKVGAADEEPGKSGIAHLLEHMMFKGTKDIPPGAFSKIVARNGGRDNAFTSSDYTGYYQNVALDRLELVMKMEADRMRNLAFDEQNFTTEKAVVIEERSSRTDNNPAALLREQMTAALFLNSPYQRPVIGWLSEIQGLTHADALAFYRRWYAPNNAILVVAGDVDAATVRPLAEKYYGVIEAADTPPRQRLKEPPVVAARTVTLTDARVRQPSWSRMVLAPSYSAGDRELAYALQVLSEVVGGGATSRLYRSLVVDQGLAASAGSSYDPDSVDLTTFSISASPRPGITMERLQAAVDKELKAIAAKGISAEEVERAKRRLEANIAYARDSLHTGAQALGESLATGRQVADVEAWPERIRAVTTDEVARATRLVLDARGSVTGLLLPDPNAPDPRGPQPAASAAPSSKGVH